MSTKLAMFLDTLFDSKRELVVMQETFIRQLEAATQADQVTPPLMQKLMPLIDHMQCVIDGIGELSNEFE